MIRILIINLFNHKFLKQYDRKLLRYMIKRAVIEVITDKVIDNKNHTNENIIQKSI